MTTASPSAAGAGKTVLLVEDQEVTREKISSLLQELGCEVIAATDGVEGLTLAKLRGDEIDMAILDIRMPRMDGITALRHLRKIPPLDRRPIVMLTTQVDTETVRTALKYKANDFIRKDATLPKIMERLQAALRLTTQAEKKPRQMEEKPRQTDPKAELAHRILLGYRKRDPRAEGPYVLCFETPIDRQALEQGRDGALVEFYRCVLEAVGRVNQTYPGLNAGYSIESETGEVVRLVKGDDAVRVVVVSGRQQDGFSLVRMMTLVGKDSLPVFLACNSRDLSLKQHGRALSMGAELLEREEVTVELLESLFEKNLPIRTETSERGVKYLELTEGTGQQPETGQLVTVHFTGRLQDGTILSDSRETGEPFQFTLGEREVIDGWEEGVRMMKEGSRGLLVVPPELGYGSEGDGKLVPPGATLFFNLELVKVATPPLEEQRGE